MLAAVPRVVRESRVRDEHLATSIYLLEWLGSRRFPWSIDELQQVLADHSRSQGRRNAYRYLNALIDAGWVQRVAMGRYQSRIRLVIAKGLPCR